MLYGARQSQILVLEWPQNMPSMLRGSMSGRPEV